MKRKCLAVLLAATMVLTMVGCGSKDKEVTGDSNAEVTESVAEDTEETEEEEAIEDAEEVEDAYDMGISAVFSTNRVARDFSVIRYKSKEYMEVTMDNIMRLIKIVNK